MMCRRQWIIQFTLKVQIGSCRIDYEKRIKISRPNLQTGRTVMLSPHKECVCGARDAQTAVFTLKRQSGAVEAK